MKCRLKDLHLTVRIQHLIPKTILGIKTLLKYDRQASATLLVMHYNDKLTTSVIKSNFKLDVRHLV